jgi:hypothetical protein
MDRAGRHSGDDVEIHSPGGERRRLLLKRFSVSYDESDDAAPGCRVSP